MEIKKCLLATSAGSEEALLFTFDGVLFAILVRLIGDAPDEQGWYLLRGFGPCDDEGLIFQNPHDAETWIMKAIEEGWRK